MIKKILLITLVALIALIGGLGGGYFLGVRFGGDPERDRCLKGHGAAWAYR